MNDKLTEEHFLQQIREKGLRKLKTKQSESTSIWEHLGSLGLIGWAVTIPTLIGAGLGWFLDKKLPHKHRWTISLLVLGLLLGCWNAWFWVCKQYKEINNDNKENHE